VTAIICNLLNLYLLILFVSIVLTWFPLSPEGLMGQIQRVLRSLTEPVLAPIRSILPSVRLGAASLDLSPMVLILGIFVIQGIICR
jgi:YggT family protein